jgi:hypothetical protein
MVQTECFSFSYVRFSASLGEIPTQNRLTRENASEDLDVEAEDDSEEEEDDEDELRLLPSETAS